MHTESWLEKLVCKRFRPWYWLSSRATTTKVGSDEKDSGFQRLKVSVRQQEMTVPPGDKDLHIVQESTNVRQEREDGVSTDSRYHFGSGIWPATPDGQDLRIAQESTNGGPEGEDSYFPRFEVSIPQQDMSGAPWWRRSTYHLRVKLRRRSKAGV